MTDSRKGFTLIELIIVIGILAVLSAALLAALNPFTQYQKASDTKTKSDLAQIQRALETYYGDFGKYPDTSGNPNYYIVGLSGNVVWGGSFAPYMSVLPNARGGKSYVYFVNQNRQAYYLYANLERAGDSQLCNGIGNQCASINTNGISPNACGTNVKCNYGVTSANVDINQ